MLRVVNLHLLSVLRRFFSWRRLLAQRAVQPELRILVAHTDQRMLQRIGILFWLLWSLVHESSSLHCRSTLFGAWFVAFWSWAIWADCLYKGDPFVEFSNFWGNCPGMDAGFLGVAGRAGADEIELLEFGDGVDGVLGCMDFLDEGDELVWVVGDVVFCFLDIRLISLLRIIAQPGRLNPTWGHHLLRLYIRPRITPCWHIMVWVQLHLLMDRAVVLSVLVGGLPCGLRRYDLAVHWFLESFVMFWGLLFSLVWRAFADLALGEQVVSQFCV